MGCGDSPGVQVGTPGNSRIGRSSSRPHKPCSKQAKLSGSHTGSSSRMETPANISSMRPRTAVWDLPGRDLPATYRGSLGSPVAGGISLI